MGTFPSAESNVTTQETKNPTPINLRTRNLGPELYILNISGTPWTTTTHRLGKD
jgi:hypothetical protein